LLSSSLARSPAACFVLVLSVALCARAVDANLLNNAGFETDSDSNGIPDGWHTYGTGSYSLPAGDSHSGSYAAELGGTSLALLYQRASGTAGEDYLCSTWAKLSTGSGAASLKLEFHDIHEARLAEHILGFTATGTWTQYTISAQAPTGTALVTAAIVGQAGGTVLFDDVSITEASYLVFDVTNTMHTFDGFGAQIWGYQDIEDELEELNIKFVRVVAGASWPQLQTMRALTDSLGIEWIYMIWGAESQFTDENGMLIPVRVADFAEWWAQQIEEMDSYGVCPHYIELVNEPDSGGSWSTGIDPADYNTLVKSVRTELDTRGYTDVGIVGPGLSNLGWDNHNGLWIGALDSTAVDSLAAWSSHMWDDGSLCDDGAACVDASWPELGTAISGKDPSGAKPVFVTEYATKDHEFHGVTYPFPEVTAGYNATDTVPYAVRVFENTLALLNNGTSAPMLWVLKDESWFSKMWGAVDPSGSPKPLYHALKTLYPKLPVGAYVVQPPAQPDEGFYGAVFVYDGGMTVALANDSESEQTRTIQLTGAAPGLQIIENIAFEMDTPGNPSTETPDIGRTVSRPLSLVENVPGTYTIDVTLPADSTLTVVIGTPDELAHPTRIEEILGVTHVAGAYNLGNTTQDFLSQGADEISALGSETIKLWFAQPDEKYPFNSTWPSSFSSLVDMAQHPYYETVFNGPFKHYILVTYSLGRSGHYWVYGISETEKADEQQQFYELAGHLLTTYAGTGKTFVIQHWEGDWAIRGSYDAGIDPTQTAIDGMIEWLNARQAGIDQARAEFGQDDVYVYHAAEVNLVAQSMNDGRPGVVNSVLPYTNLDLVSYSAYDTESSPTGFGEALDYIAMNMPDSAAFGNKNVYIGEYGLPENDSGLEAVQNTVQNVVETALAWGCPYIVYWEVYCNEYLRLPVVSSDDVRGFWLVKPDGTKSWVWHYLHDLIVTDSDGDGIPDMTEGEGDPDDDGVPNYLDTDSDGDGLPDQWEANYDLDPYDDGGSDPSNGPDGDPDGDGYTNLEEYESGTEPTDASSHPSMVQGTPLNPIVGVMSLLLAFLATALAVMGRNRSTTP